MTTDSCFFKTAMIRNLLSFGSDSSLLELQPLNVFIGSNANGKSNLIEVLSLLRACPRDIVVPIREGGGINDWLWKGQKESPVASIDVTVDNPKGRRANDGRVIPLRHEISFTMSGPRFEIVDESVENSEKESETADDVRFYYRYQKGDPVLSVIPTEKEGSESNRFQRRLQSEDIPSNRSILSERKDPVQYPEITYLGNQYSRIKIYREWDFGSYTAPRLPQKPDLPEDELMEDASNLGLVLNNLEHKAGVRETILRRLKEFSDSIQDFSLKIHGGTVQVYVHESDLAEPIPATRLSDGTLHYLCLLAILCNPDPPPVICLEEPEIGLHPDILPTVADLLKEASERAQIFVTTHSDILVDALSDLPESVVVCEKTGGSTSMKRLHAQDLNQWLAKYRLGKVWRMGEIGGNRW